MRKPADWMTSTDERILEVLFEVGEETPSTIRHRIKNEGLEYHRKHIGRRCRELATKGLLQKPRTGIYAITDLGRGFIAGEVNLQEVDPETPGESIDYQWRDSAGTTDSKQRPADVGLWPSTDVDRQCAVCGRSLEGNPYTRVSLDTSHTKTHSEYYVGSACRNFLMGALVGEE